MNDMLKLVLRHRRYNCQTLLRLLTKQRIDSRCNCRAASGGKWSSGVDIDEEAEAKLRAGQRLKQRNFETKLFFGPVIPNWTPKEVAASQATPTDAKPTTCTIRVRESGYIPNDRGHINRLVIADSSSITQLERTESIKVCRKTATPKRQPKLAPATIRQQAVDKVIPTQIPPKADTNVTASVAGADVSLLPSTQRLCSFPMTIIGGAKANTGVEQSLLEEIKRFWSWRNDRPTISLVSEPSVSTVLQQSMSAENLAVLERWKEKMVELLGVDGFAKYQKETFEVGTQLHLAIAREVGGESLAEDQLDRRIIGHWKSMRKIFPDISDVILQEQPVRHPVLRYRGILDCVAKYRGITVLIEWKTSHKQKGLLQFTYDKPLQVAAYIGALNFSEQLGYQITRAAIVIAYADGAPAHVHYMNEELCRKYWIEWLQRLHKFLELS